MNDDFDPQEWLAGLRRATADHAKVVAQRSSPADVSSDLLAFVNAMYVWTDKSKGPDGFPLWKPSSDSVASIERERFDEQIVAFCSKHSPQSTMWLDTNPVRNMSLWSMDVLRRYVLTVFDALAGAAVLMPQNGHVRAPIILARWALEAIAAAKRIVDPSLTFDERARRLLNLRFMEVKASATTDAGADDSTLADLLAFASHLGYEARISRQSWQPPVIPHPSGERESAGKAIEDLLPSLGREFWHHQSAVTHSQAAAMLVADEYSSPHEILLWQQAEHSCLNLLPVVLALAETLPSISNYAGWPEFTQRDFIEKCQLSLASCAGMGDDTIRGALGLTS